MHESVPVLIVGAGPTGLTAAALLAQFGVPTVVVERWPQLYPQPRAVHMDDEVFRIVGQLGLAPQLCALTRPAAGLRLMDRDHRVLAQFSRGQGIGVHGYPQANMFDQPDLENLLRAYLLRRPRIHLRGGAEVTDVHGIAGGGVRVTYRQDPCGAEHVIDATYVLGCDGANSTVRRAIGATMIDLGFTQRWLVVDVDTSVPLHQWDGVHQVCNPARAATFMRVGTTRYRWEFQLRSGETAETFSAPSALLPLISPWTAAVRFEELRVIRLAEYTFRAQLADRWRMGNTFLLGDAAHLTPPFIGQGLGAGLRDAINLAWKVAGVLNGDLKPSLLDSYEQERNRTREP